MDPSSVHSLIVSGEGAQNRLEEEQVKAFSGQIVGDFEKGIPMAQVDLADYPAMHFFFVC